MAISCERQIPNVPGLKDQEITVGRHVFLQCTGDYEKSFQFPQAKVILAENSKFSTKVYKAEARSVSQFDVDLVFYSAGEFVFPDLILSDGTNEIHLGEQKFLVQTVLEKTQAEKKPEPFPPFFPIKLSWPTSYLIVCLALIAVVVALVIWNIRKRFRYRQLMAKLNDYQSSVEPDMQFYRSIRRAEMSGYRISDLDNSFRLYIARRYKVPAFDLKNPSLLRFFKKNNPWLKKERLELKKILEDLKDVKDSEAEKKILTQKMYQFVDKSELLLSKVPR